MFAAKCVPAGRLFTRRMINLLSDRSHNSSHIALSPDFHLDINWWTEFLPRWNGHASFIPPHGPIVPPSDSIPTHRRWLQQFLDGHWFSSAWPDWLDLTSFSIGFLESCLSTLPAWYGKTFLSTGAFPSPVITQAPVTPGPVLVRPAVLCCT